MGRRILCRLLPVALAALLGLADGRPAEAAAPRLIMVSGPLLARPVVLADWQENLSFMVAIVEEAKVGADELAGRPRLELGLFWGQSWVDEAGKPRPGLRPEQAQQLLWFYPAIGEAEPIVRFEWVPEFSSTGPLRSVQPGGLAILARHGIPTRVEPWSPAPATAPALPNTGGGGHARAPLSRPLGAGVLALVGLSAWHATGRRPVRCGVPDSARRVGLSHAGARPPRSARGRPESGGGPVTAGEARSSPWRRSGRTSGRWASAYRSRRQGRRVSCAATPSGLRREGSRVTTLLCAASLLAVRTAPLALQGVGRRCRAGQEGRPRVAVRGLDGAYPREQLVVVQQPIELEVQLGDRRDEVLRDVAVAPHRPRPGGRTHSVTPSAVHTLL